MYDDLYCKIFIDTDLIYEELFTLLLEFLDGKKYSLDGICNQWCDISVRRNKEFSDEQYLLNPKDFIFWRYYLDVEPVDSNNVEESIYIENISNLLKYIKRHCNDAIAACDFEDEFEDELKWKGLG